MTTEPSHRIRALGPRLIDVFLHSVQRILLASNQLQSLSAVLAAGGKQVHTVSVYPLPGEMAAASSEGLFDCIVVDAPEIAAIEKAIDAVVPYLDTFGSVYILACDPGHRAGDINAVIDTAGLRRYLAWRFDEGTGFAVMPAAEHEAFDVAMAVRGSYDPVQHARHLLRQRRPDWAFEVLNNYPDHLITEYTLHAAIAAEKQLCYLAWGRRAEPRERVKRFYFAQREFYHATTIDPHYHQAYLCHAESWRSIGNEDMAVRLLRSLQHAAPSPLVAKRLDSFTVQPAPRLPERVPSLWSGAWRPRLLLICHEHSDYGFDTLFEGLCRVLGADCVIEFPWKPSLHGEAPETAKDYPCTFNLPGEPRDAEWVCAQLLEGRFDAVFYCDTLFQLDVSMVHKIMAAAGDTPLFILDTWDEGGDYFSDTIEHLGRTSAHAYFKREMLDCGIYSPNTFPLPFSYPDGRVTRDITGSRERPFFWAGKRQDGTRRLYLEYIEKKFNLSLNETFSQEEYARALDQTRIGLNLFGLGFDTVRYWELPAHGCMLLSERPPIRIPNNFVDGQSAVFFDDLPELEKKLAFYLSRPDEVARIARAGHDHLLRHHTNSVRAKQLLGWMEAVLGTTAL